MLENFEFDTSLTDLSQTYDWLYWTLRTIDSPVFNQFVIWLPNEGVLAWYPTNTIGWGAVDAVLKFLAERNTFFRVVFRAGFPSFLYHTRHTYSGVPSFIANYLPIVSSMGLVKFEHVPRVGNWSRKLGSP